MMTSFVTLSKIFVWDHKMALATSRVARLKALRYVIAMDADDGATCRGYFVCPPLRHQ